MKRVFLFLFALPLIFFIPKTVSAANDPALNLNTNIVCVNGDWSGQFGWAMPLSWTQLHNAGIDKDVWLDWKDNVICDNWNRDSNGNPICFNHQHAMNITYYPVNGNEFHDNGKYSWRVNINYGSEPLPNEIWSPTNQVDFTTGVCASGGGGSSAGGNIGDWFLLGGGRSIKEIFSSVSSVVSVVIIFLFSLGALAAFIMILIGGIKYMLSGGDVEAAAAARSTVTYAIIGLILVVCAFVIVKVLSTILGYNII